VIDLSFEVRGAEVLAYAAVPSVSLLLEVGEGTGATVHALALRVQVRIEPQRRRYEPADEERLVELFGQPAQWGESLRPFQWTQLGTVVPAFRHRAEVPLALECSYDLEVVAHKYLHNLRSGEVPLLLLFSGTAFVVHDGALVVEPVPWNLEARYRLPVALWRQAVDRFFPDSGWLRLSTGTIDAVAKVKARHALPTWDQALELLLKQAGEDGP
jgi:hypothetical protein